MHTPLIRERSMYVPLCWIFLLEFIDIFQLYIIAFILLNKILGKEISFRFEAVFVNILHRYSFLREQSLKFNTNLSYRWWFS